MNPSDVIVIGGGLNGVTLALALRKAGLSVVLVDQQPLSAKVETAYDGRAYAIAYACFRQWRALGLADALLPHAQRIEQILVSDGRAPGGAAPAPASTHLRFLADELPDTGEPLGYMIEARRIQAVLNTALLDSGVRICVPRKPIAMETTPNGARLTLDDGTAIDAKLVVAADGKASWVRQQSGIETIGWDYGQDALVLTVGFEKPHNGVAHEFFLAGGPFAILPLSDNRANIVWTEKRASAQGLLDLPPELFKAAFMRRFGPHLGAVEILTPVWRYPLGLQIAVTDVAVRTVLIGDASHVIHPLAGQGLNLGLKDVAALSEVLVAAAQHGEDIGAEITLERYARLRRFDTVSMALATEGFNRLFSNDIPGLRTLRDAGMAAVDAVPLLRQMFARAAGADVGALPTALRTEMV